MTFQHPGAEALDYFPCRYGKSKLLFRGPKRRLDGPYIAALGGTETYGKYISEPWPALIEQAVGMPVVNFGYVNAGIDVFANEPEIAEACAGARTTVIQLVGAQNMSNRFYAVHPRRNDRFLRASALMRTLFREIDFTEFHFTRHMLSELRQHAPDKFGMIEAELKEAWVARMRQFIRKLQGRAVLLWLQGAQPERRVPDGLGPDPLFLDDAMVEDIAAQAAALVRVTPSSAAKGAGTDGMVYPPLEETVAAGMPGPQVHAEIAAALAPVLERLR